jgi:hypothetical protein
MARINNIFISTSTDARRACATSGGPQNHRQAKHAHGLQKLSVLSVKGKEQGAKDLTNKK